LVRDLADALLDARLARLPARAAEAVELHPGLLRAEAREHLDVLDRHEELVTAVVEHAQAIVGSTRDLDRLEALVAADAVLDVDDQVARGQARDLGNEILGTAPPARRAYEAVAEDVLLGDDR